MLIEIHTIQNHSPANLNRDDLGSPKTCYFGGVLRSRISSQCIKRSIRTSESFKALCGGIRTRQLAKVIAARLSQQNGIRNRVENVLGLCGFKPKKGNDENSPDKSKMLVYTTYKAIDEMAKLFEDNEEKSEKDLAREFGELISKRVAVPDMALSGRMLEPDKSSKDIWKGLPTTVDAALQVAHAISTHEARPEVDYYVAADDMPGDDAGAGYVDEAIFASACFYKYFSINWETLLNNLEGNKELAAHTVGAFIRAVAIVNPTGKQNSFAAHNPPDGMVIEIKKTPISYANAFAKPVAYGERDIISQSIAQLAQYIDDLDAGYGRPDKRFWFSPNLRYHLTVLEGKKDKVLYDEDSKSLDLLVSSVVASLGYNWEAVRKEVVREEVAS